MSVPHAEAHSRRYATLSDLFPPQAHAGFPPLDGHQSDIDEALRGLTLLDER
jgi:hypothetical protein